MRVVAALLSLVTVAAGTWLGDEYWTLIGSHGHPAQGDVGNFATVANFFNGGDFNRFVALWMTNQHYPGLMFEQFGEAFLREDLGKFCARFAGRDGEGVEICENFRVLTVPDRLSGQRVFEWVRFDAFHGQESDKIGFGDIRICALAYDPEQSYTGLTYSGFDLGDAVVSRQAVRVQQSHANSPRETHKYMLRLLVAENPHRGERHNAHHHHHHHHQEQQQQQEQLGGQDHHVKQARYEPTTENDDVIVEAAQQLAPARAHHAHAHRTDDYLCDAHGRMWQRHTVEGRFHYRSYDPAAYIAQYGRRPVCTLISDTVETSE